MAENFYDRLDEILDGAHEGQKRNDTVDALDALYAERQTAEVERLRAERACICPKGPECDGPDRGCPKHGETLDDVRARLQVVNEELDETTHVLAVTGEKATALRKQRDQAETERDQARAELATVLKNYEILQGTAIRLEGERDEARAELAKSDELLATAHNDLCEALSVRHRPLLDVIQHAATVRAEVEQWRATFGETALRDAQKILAERDAVREQVKRVREVAACLRRHEANLKERYDKATNDARATALLSSAALTGDAAHRIERALGGTEPGQ